MDRWLQLILTMPEDDYITNKQLAAALGVSNRTVYSDISQLNEVMKDHGAELITKPHYGVKLVVIDRTKYLSFINSFDADEFYSAGDSESRINHIIEKLVTADEPIVMDDLCEELYISRSTLKKDMKKVRSTLSRYDLKIDAKPYAGISLTGTEKNLRKCLARVEHNLISNNELKLNDKLNDISEIVKRQFHRHSYSMATYSYYNFLIHIYICIIRIRKGKQIEKIRGYEKEIDEEIKNIADDLINELESVFQIKFSIDEYVNILIHLACKKIVAGKDVAVVDSSAYSLVNGMLDKVREAFGYDFRHDFELITNLCAHISSLKYRILFDMPFENPLTQEIRSQAPLAYEIATVACDKFTEIYSKKMTADEIAYIALHFNVAMERRKKRNKKNVLLVCGTGKGSAMFLQYRIEEEYGKYLNVIGTHEAYELSRINYSNIDYVLTTVHLDEHVPVPVIEIDKLFDTDGKKAIQKYILQDLRKTLLDYFNEELFIPHMQERTKEELLKELCSSAMKQKNVSGEFYKQVMERESIGKTAFGNSVAIPHPIRPFGDDSFVVTGILDQPVLWDDEEVQIIFLISMKDGGDHNLQTFYKSVSRFISDRTLIDDLIREQTFENLIGILGSLTY